MLTKYLEDLESRIDPIVEESLLRQWRGFWENPDRSVPFRPARTAAAPPRFEWPQVSVNNALADDELMILRELSKISGHLAEASGALPAVRCNYGTGIIPSAFGAELFVMDETLDTLPTTRPLESAEVLRECLQRGVPAPEAGLGEAVFRTAEKFRDLLRTYPKIDAFVTLYHPDFQGPMDITELLYGSGLFIDLLDTPEFVKDLLQLATDTYIGFMERWESIVPPREDGYGVHWYMLHRGRIMLRNDSAMNLSPEMFEEFIKPYDSQLLKRFGGAVHFCGRGDHYLPALSEIEGLHAINMSQPEYNEMETIFRYTVDKGIKILGLPESGLAGAEERSFSGNLHAGKIW